MTKAKFIEFDSTPPLWENQQFSVQQFYFPTIDFDSFVPKPIPENLRLGHKMEHIFHQLITYSNTYEILIQNLPIRAEKQTLGEIDFILKHRKTKKLIHVELTYKFYLIDTKFDDPLRQLVGPNRHDAFFTKIKKIKNKQFQLLHTEEGIKELINRDLDMQSVIQQCCFKAQLFRPYNLSINTLFPYNATCIVGVWLGFKYFLKETFGTYEFHIPPKLEWASTPHFDIAWQSFSEILLQVTESIKKEKSPMLWVRKNDLVIEKMFVVWWA